MTKSPVVVEARNLVKKYGTQRVINNINLVANHGECFGILGPSGAGKSSLLAMMYGSSRVTSGELFVLNLNVTNNILKIKDRLGIVGQNDGLDRDFTVMDNLLIFATYFRIPIPQARTRARELLRLMRLEDFENKSVDALDPSMKRRLAIARALINKPDLIILDEPSAGLDLPQRQQVLDAIKLLKTHGQSIILSTHYLEEAESICDRIVILDHGKILCEGRPDQLIREHVGREVVEFLVDRDDLDYHVKKIKPLFQYQVLNNRLRMFIPEGTEGKEALQLVASRSMSLRPATLDDVFLKHAGFELKEI